MFPGPVRARFADGRWHFQHGPIDLIIGADGARPVVDAAIEACWREFGSVLRTLVSELPALRSAWRADLKLAGPVARRMARACAPFARDWGLFITPMAAVAGSVADELIECFRRPDMTRAYINNGGDIALHLTGDASFDVGMVTNVEAPALDGGLHIEAGDRIRGIATSGWRGRSLSLGIADSVTVLARDAAAADAAATIIANHVDVDHAAIERAPANSLRDDSDLGDRLVTVAVPPLPRTAVDAALDRGAECARRCIERGWVQATLLTLQGCTRMLDARMKLASLVTA
jgi:hypothetical protein